MLQQQLIDLNVNKHNLDIYFNQPSPYKYPPLLICNDIKHINNSQSIYNQSMDVITDNNGNRFNIRNKHAAGILQAGYSANIDLDSHLKNINYYADKCYYDNWKISPNTTNNIIGNSLKQNANILSPNYTAVGRHYEDCIGICSNNSACLTNLTPIINSCCWNTPPTDLNCETNVRKRYDFSHNKFQTKNCSKPNDLKTFEKSTKPTITLLEQNKTRDAQIINSINNDYQHDYYKFFDSNQCIIYPNQRLFNNITKQSMLPNHHFHNCNPIYLK